MKFTKGDRVQLVHDADSTVERTITGKTIERRRMTYWGIIEVCPILWPMCAKGVGRWVPEDQLELFVSKVVRRKWGQRFVDGDTGEEVE